MPDFTTPSAARMYDYFLGGKTHFQADREAADRVLVSCPEARRLALANRRFLTRAVWHLADHGVRQYIDLGSGLPTSPNVHEVARQVRPDARVVYVDSDPVAASHGRVLCDADDGLAFVEADIRDPQSILEDRQFARMIDFAIPVAVLAVSVLHFLPDEDHPQQILEAFRARMTVGSYVVISHATSEGADSQALAEIAAAYKESATPAVPRTSAAISALFAGFDLVDPGLVDMYRWRSDMPEESDGVRFLAGAGRLSGKVTAGSAALVRHDRGMRRYDTVMTDHPAWTPAAGAWIARVMPSPDGSHALVQTDGARAEWCCTQAAAHEPGIFSLPAGTVPELTAPLKILGPVARFANPSLWDAIATAVIRQVVRADQARAQYRALCRAHGTEVRCGHLAGWLLPSPEAMLALEDAQFKAIGLAFKREALRAAAEAFLKDGDAWASLTAQELAAVLPSIRRIGPWTAGAAAADWSNDFSVYPYGDLAVRTWAAKAAPDAGWPGDEPGFRTRWERVTGPHLADITLLTLAWGGHHARTST